MADLASTSSARQSDGDGSRAGSTRPYSPSVIAQCIVAGLGTESVGDLGSYARAAVNFASKRKAKQPVHTDDRDLRGGVESKPGTVDIRDVLAMVSGSALQAFCSTPPVCTPASPVTNFERKRRKVAGPRKRCALVC